jgi:hypothetical protein
MNISKILKIAAVGSKKIRVIRVIRVPKKICVPIRVPKNPRSTTQK